jgi:hypothetical protein
MNAPVYKGPPEVKAKIRAALRKESKPRAGWFCLFSLPLAYDRGYHFCGWNSAGLNYFCISEISSISLEAFEDQVREHTNLCDGAVLSVVQPARAAASSQAVRAHS